MKMKTQKTNTTIYPNKKYPFIGVELYNIKNKLAITQISFQEGNWGGCYSLCAEGSLEIHHYNPKLFSKLYFLERDNKRKFLGDYYLAIAMDMGKMSYCLVAAAEFKDKSKAETWCNGWGGVDTQIIKAKKYSEQDWCGKEVVFVLETPIDFYT